MGDIDKQLGQDLGSTLSGFLEEAHDVTGALKPDALKSKTDVTIASDTEVDGNGDIIFKTGGQVRARIKADGTGSGWPAVLGGYIPAVDAKLSPYNATGDGSTDDAAAIQAAIDSLKTTGGVVFLPLGTYIIGTPLTVWSRVRLIGATHAPNGCMLKAKAGLNNAVVKCGATDGSDPNWHWGEISSLTVDGNTANQSTPSASTVSTATVSGSGIVATITTSAAHGLSIGDVVLLSGFTPAGYNGRYPVNAVTSSTVFTVNLLFGPAANATVVGTARRVVNGINLPQAGENSQINVVVQNCLEDGIYQGPVGTPMNYGRVEASNNGGAGVSLWTDRPVVFGQLSGDSNTGGLLRVNGKASAGANAVGSVTIVFIKAENHTVPVVVIDDYPQAVTLVGGAITMSSGNSAACMQRTSSSQNSRIHSIGVTYTPQWSGAGNIFQDLSPVALSVNTGNSSATSKPFHVTDSNDGYAAVRFVSRDNTLTDAATVAVNMALGNFHELTCSSGVGASRTIGAPTNSPNGQPRAQMVTFRIFNNTAGALTTSWNAAYILAGGAWTDPGVGKSRFVTFIYNGTSWYEISRSSADT